MFDPAYLISADLLNTIKEITLLTHTLNQRIIGEPLLAQLQSDADAQSTYATTSIEGNPLSLTAVKNLLKSTPKNLSTTEQEIINVNSTLQWMYQNPIFPFDHDFILTLHRKITTDLLPAHQIGTYRQDSVVVNNPKTGEVVYLPPDHTDVPALMDDLLTFVQENRHTLDPVLLAGIFHKQFVIIHPFTDGNGRTTRLATKRVLADMGLDLFRLVSFENFYNQNVTRYFKTVGLFGNYYDLAPTIDFSAWLTYFAQGILASLNDLPKTLTQATTPSTKLAKHHIAILNYIDQNGFINDKAYAKITDRAKATRALDFKKLIELGYIERKGVGRATHYSRN